MKTQTYTISDLKFTSMALSIRSYFATIVATFRPGMQVTVKDGLAWNGHKPGEVGEIVSHYLAKVQGRQVQTKAVAVKWSDGTIDWGMHMDKLKVIGQ